MLENLMKNKTGFEIICFQPNKECRETCRFRERWGGGRGKKTVDLNQFEQDKEWGNVWNFVCTRGD